MRRAFKWVGIAAAVGAMVKGKVKSELEKSAGGLLKGLLGGKK